MGRVLLISSNFPPVTGGSAVVYENICRAAHGAVAGLGASRDYATGNRFANAEAYDRKAGYPIHRLGHLWPAANRKSGLLGDLVLMARVLLKTLAIARQERIRA